MLSLDLQDLATVSASTMTHPDSTMGGNGFATLRLEFLSTQGDRLALTLFGHSAEELMQAVEKAVSGATMQVAGKAG